MCDVGSVTTDLPQSQRVGRQYTRHLDQFLKGQGILLDNEAQYKPQFISQTLADVNQAEPDWLNLYKNASAGAAQSNVDNAATYGGRAASAVRAINPGGAALTDQLLKTTGDELAAGTSLTPGAINRVTSGVRSDWARRGLGDSNPAQLDEAVNLATEGQNVLNQREGAAAGAVNTSNWITAPALGMTNTGAMGKDLLTGSAALATGAAPTLVNEAANYDMYNTLYNANSAALINKANSSAAMNSAMIGAVGGGASSMASY